MKSLILVIVLIHTINAVEWINGRGAKVSFVEVEAENAHHNGKIIGNDRTYGKLSSEASQRRAVQLNAVGQYVEFTMPIQANSIVVRYSLPDTPEGKDVKVRDAPIDLYVNNSKLKSMMLTSRYSWFYGVYPFTNKPGVDPHHFYTEDRTMFDKTYPAGTKVKLQVSSISQSPTFTIDLADFELIGPPKTKPDNSLSVIDFHADPSGKTDSNAAFQQAINAGRDQKKVVFIPPGTYLIHEHIIVDKVHLVGAGPWYSVLTGRLNRYKAVGVYGKLASDNGGSHSVLLKDFAIIGDIRERIDDAPVSAIGGALSDSIVDNIWMQHTKCGAWVDGPMNNFTIKNSRIIDTTADGVNFHIGVTNSRVENTFLRNNGDDGLAIWAQNIPSVNVKFINNTIGCPILANNIAIYGGKDIDVSDNFVYDTLSNGGGIHIANRYPGVFGNRTISGTHTVYRNTLLRTGNNDYNWHFGIGAIWFSGLNEEINKAKIHVKDCDIIDSSYSAIGYIQGKTFGVTFENVLINGTGTFALQIQAGGEATFKNVKAINVAQKDPIYNCHQEFKINIEGEKSGWYSEKPYCGDWPKPKWLEN